MSTETTITPGYMSQPEAALYLNVSDSTFEEWVRVKKLPFYRPSWERRFKKEDLDNWMSAYKDVRRKQRKKKGGSAMQRFFSKVEITDGCWNWTASTSRGGYGYYHYKGREHTAHRFLYEALNGPVPSSLHMDHLCRNRACVRPSHLEPVTPAENLRRGFWGMKTHCPKGHPYDEQNTTRNHRSRICVTCHREHARTAQKRLDERGLCITCWKPRDNETKACTVCRQKSILAQRIRKQKRQSTTPTTVACPTVTDAKVSG